MSVITVLMPDDLAPNQNKEREYDMAFNLLRRARSSRHGSAKFHVFQVWDENGRNVMGEERAMVVKHALECYYTEMLIAVRGRGGSVAVEEEERKR